MSDTCILSYSLSVFTIHLICLEVSRKRCNFALEMSNIRTYEISHSEQKPLPILQKDTTDYILGGSLVMRNGKIDKVLFEGGYAQATAANSTTDKFAFNYYNQDHLGNNREVVDAKGVVQQVTNYYPFGAPYADATAIKGAAVQPYKYNGKELDLMHGLNTYDYGARQHDPILARWDRIDPLCEKYYNVSPYAYCVNNPVRFIDPDGRHVRISDGKGHQYLYYNSLLYRWGKDQNGHIVPLKPIKVAQNSFMGKVLNALNTMAKSKNKVVQTVFNALTDIKDNHANIIKQGGANEQSKTSPEKGGWENNIRINFEYDKQIDSYGELKYQTFYDCLGHELKHAYDHQMGISSNSLYPGHDFTYTEFSTVYFENILRGEHKALPRLTYRGIPINSRNIPKLYQQPMVESDWNDPKYKKDRR